MRDIPCPRCLLAETPDGQALHAVIQEYLAALPEETRAPGARYAARLAHCRACDHLAAGTCRLCGCYVEARAAKALQRCPHVPPKW